MSKKNGFRSKKSYAEGTVCVRFLDLFTRISIGENGQLPAIRGLSRQGTFINHEVQKLLPLKTNFPVTEKSLFVGIDDDRSLETIDKYGVPLLQVDGQLP